MKFSRNLGAVLACLALLSGMPFFAGCGGDDDNTVQPPPTPTPTTGSIIGTAQLPPGLPGDLGNARVGIYTDLNNWQADVPARPFSRVIGTGASVTIQEVGLTPGSYFVEVWQDTDHSGTFTANDWWGISGTPTWPSPTPSFVMVSAGGTAMVTIYLIAIP